MSWLAQVHGAQWAAAGATPAGPGGRGLARRIQTAVRPFHRGSTLVSDRVPPRLRSGCADVLGGRESDRNRRLCAWGLLFDGCEGAGHMVVDDCGSRTDAARVRGGGPLDVAEAAFR